MDRQVCEGDEFEVEIISTGAKGDGIAKVDGYTVFVPGGEPGQVVKIKITKALEKFAFSEILNS